MTIPEDTTTSSQLLKNKKILDFGCGLGGFIKLAKKSQKYVMVLK